MPTGKSPSNKISAAYTRVDLSGNHFIEVQADEGGRLLAHGAQWVTGARPSNSRPPSGSCATG